MKKVVAWVLCAVCLFALAGCGAADGNAPESSTSAASEPEAALSRPPASPVPSEPASEPGVQYTVDDVDVNLLPGGDTRTILSPTFRQELEQIRNGAALSEEGAMDLTMSLYTGYFSFMQRTGLVNQYDIDGGTRLKIDILQEYCDRSGLKFDVLSLPIFAENVSPSEPEYIVWSAGIGSDQAKYETRNEQIEFTGNDTFVYSYEYYIHWMVADGEISYEEEYQGIWRYTYQILEDYTYIPYQFLEGNYDPDGTDIAKYLFTYKTTDVLNLRSGPSTEDEVVEQVPAGETVYVDDRTLDTGWVRAMYYGGEGWLNTEYIVRDVLA